MANKYPNDWCGQKTTSEVWADRAKNAIAFPFVFVAGIAAVGYLAWKAMTNPDAVNCAFKL